jgi:hypothetical protein
MSKSKKPKFDLDAAKDFAIRECAPKKKRELIAQQAVWELFKELEKDRAAEIELEIQEDDSELDESEKASSSPSTESASLIQQVVAQAKVFGVAGLMTITTGVYFQSQAVIKNVEDIQATVSEMRISSQSNSNVVDGLNQSEQIQSIAESTAENAETASEESQESSEESQESTEESQESTEESSEESTEESQESTEESSEESQESSEESSEESTEGSQESTEETPLESTEELSGGDEPPSSSSELPPVLDEEETETETQPELIEPIVIDIPLPHDTEIPSDRG